MNWLTKAIRNLSKTASPRNRPATRGPRRTLGIERLEDRTVMSGSMLGSTLEFATATGAAPAGIVAGPNGTVWFTEPGKNRIGELIPGSRPGVANIVEYDIGTARQPYSLTLGRDGHIWFTERNAYRIGELVPGSRPGLANVVEYQLARNATPGQITVGPDGNLWFTESGLSRIGQLIPGGRPGVANIVEYDAGHTESSLLSITNGPGGTLWFPNGHTIEELIPGSRPGVADIIPYAVSSLARPLFITGGLDGHVWFTESGTDRIAELIPGSRPGLANVVEYGLNLNGNAGLGGIVMASDGNLWFTESARNQIGELIPDRTQPGRGLANVIQYAAGSPARPGLGAWITVGPDGNVWYSETGADRIAAMTSIDPNDPLATKYGALGAGTGLLGAPTSLEQTLSAVPGVRAAGKYQSFQGGMIYWSAATGAHEVHGAVLGEWGSLGWERSFLGYPTSDESQAAGGRYSTFQGGAVYWSPATGAHEVHGAILSKWISLGAERSFLGFPTSNERAAVGGRFNTFQGGVVYWSPATGAHEVHGAIYSAWAGLGWERGFLGFPTSDEYAYNGGRRSDFQGGFIVWTPQGGTQVIRK